MVVKIEAIAILVILPSNVNRKRRLAIKSFDSDDVAIPSKRRLKQRNDKNVVLATSNTNRNDKLNPFGFCIHAGIDWFSRKIV